MAHLSSQDLYRHIGLRIAHRRLVLNLSRAALAESVGLTRRQLRGIESGRDPIPIDWLHAIAHRLYVPVWFFFRGFEDTTHSDKPPSQAP